MVVPALTGLVFRLDSKWDSLVMQQHISFVHFKLSFNDLIVLFKILFTSEVKMRGGNTMESSLPPVDHQ